MKSEWNTSAVLTQEEIRMLLGRTDTYAPAPGHLSPEKQEEEEKVISDPPPTWEERKECALWQMPVIEEIQPGRKHAVKDRLSMQRKLVNRF